jgi:hypothetical protein
VTQRLAPTSTGIKVGPLRLTEPTPIVAEYQMLEDDELVICDASGGSFTLTMPDVTGDVRPFYIIKKIDAVANVTVEGKGTQTIDGADVEMTAQYQAVILVPDGTTWHTVVDYTP